MSSNNNDNTESLLKVEVEELKGKLKECQDTIEKEKEKCKELRDKDAYLKECIRLGY